jgi:drug/metabolite transporter (DMT)-like permease
VCAIVCWPFIASAIPNGHELMILAAFGITNGALGYILFLTGGRHIPSGEAGLIGLIDVVLGPLWVWLAFGEQPGRSALVGGLLVVVPVLWYLSSARRSGLAALRAVDVERRSTENGVIDTFGKPR